MQNIAGKRVLITGGAGFIGGHLGEALQTAGAHVAVLDDLSTGQRSNVPPGIEIAEIDITEDKKIIRFIKELKPEIVAHLAAQTSVSRSVAEPQKDALINIIGGLNVLEACRASQSTEHFVFASTGGTVYGEVERGSPATEDRPLDPRSPYAIHKAAFERLLVGLGTDGMKTASLRLGNVYGPRQDPNGEAGVVAIFLARMFVRQTVHLYGRRKAGDGGCYRDYIHVSDVVAAFQLVLARRLPGVFNVGTGIATSTSEILSGLESLLGQQSCVSHDAPRPGDLQCSVLDSTRLQAAGWQPRVALAEGLAATVAWFQGVNQTPAGERR